MATWDDVARLCAALAGTGELTSRDGHRQWRVAEKLFGWERPLIAGEPEVYFRAAHFTGYPAVLCRLERLGAPER